MALAMVTECLQNRIGDIDRLLEDYNHEDFILWKELVHRYLSRFFGSNSPHFNKVFRRDIDFDKPEQALRETRPLLRSYLTEVRETGLPERLKKLEAPFRPNNKVFIVHGRDRKALTELVELSKKFGLEPIVLLELPDIGRTIIEKLIEETSEIGYAFVILTPDDLGCLEIDYTDRDCLETRTRQNVLLEMGYFIGKIGRENVCILCKHGLEDFATDILGVLYKPFKDSVSECEDAIKLDLQVAEESGQIVLGDSES